MKPVFVTLNIAIVAVAAVWIATHQNAQARAGSFLSREIPGVTLSDLPLERTFSFTVDTGTLPQQSAQGPFGFTSQVAVMQGPVSPGLGIVLTGFNTMQANIASLKSVSVLIDSQLVYTGAAEPTTGIYTFRPILVRPGSFLRIETASGQAFTVQGYTVDAGDLALP